MTARLARQKTYGMHILSFPLRMEDDNPAQVVANLVTDYSFSAWCIQPVDATTTADLLLCLVLLADKEYANLGNINLETNDLRNIFLCVI